MSSPAMPLGGAQWSNAQTLSQGQTTSNMGDGSNEDGVSVRPMRLKVLYSFDEQNKTNCLARWPHVLQVQCVAMDETQIGVVELNTCIQAIVQCSPELVARLGQDYTIYAYDYSEYDTPLVGQGMLSWALAAASPNPNGPAQQTSNLITGRVSKNIMGLFSNGIKETLEVKLRLVPVPTMLPTDNMANMEKLRELSKVMPTGFDANEWNSFLQSNPSLNQMANKATPTPAPIFNREGSSMEVFNQLLSPSLQQQPMPNPFNQAPNMQNTGAGNESQNESSQPAKNGAGSRPSSRASTKRPRKPRQPKNTGPKGGNTSGYEEGTDGDEGPQPKKRAKVTKADFSSKNAIGAAPESLRVAASTAGSLRLFRPIAMSPMPIESNHLQEPPRAPTPVPKVARPQRQPNKATSNSGPRRESFTLQEEAPRRHISPYPILDNPEDQLRFSIESANASPEKIQSPIETPPDIGSSPPVMRTRPPSPSVRSSPPCPSSPELPQMPRMDSGFMSSNLDDLFGEEDEPMMPPADDVTEGFLPKLTKFQAPQPVAPHQDSGLIIEEVMPGPADQLPTKMNIYQPNAKERSARAWEAKARAGSVMSEDGQQVLPPLKKDNRVASRPPSQPPAEKRPSAQSRAASREKTPVTKQESKKSPTPILEAPVQKAPSPVPQAQPKPRSRPASRTMNRTASLGNLNQPPVPASDPVLPPSSLQRSHTWSEFPPAPEAPMVPMAPQTSLTLPSLPPPPPIPDFMDPTMSIKERNIKQKLEQAIANGEMPPFCGNCGAVETPSWRKAWSQNHEGEPGYHEYSDAPGCVTCITILSRDETGKPLSYQLIKKYLSTDDDPKDYEEFLLCNPCGLYLSKYKTQRPEEKFAKYVPLPRSRADGTKPRRPQQKYPKKKKDPQPVPTSETNFPPSEMNFPQSEAFFPHSEAHFPQSEANFVAPESLQQQNLAPGGGISPTDTTTVQDKPADKAGAGEPRRPSMSSNPAKRSLKAIISESAPEGLARALRSSPGTRWHGSQASPVEVEDDGLGSTRRLLFPSPRKDGSPKVLGEVTTNVVQISVDASPLNKDALVALVEAKDKENSRPAIQADEADGDLLKLFEEEMARPSTPTGKSPKPNVFKTPTQKTPNHRPITRSVSKSIRSIRSQMSPRDLLFAATPSKSSSALRRSPRNHHHQGVFESPFTATLNQLMSESHNQPATPSRSLELEFGNLPDLPNLSGNGHAVDVSFNLEEFFSTDVPMPSSPPRMFQMYEDTMAIGNINWDEIGDFGGSGSGSGSGTQDGAEEEGNDDLDRVDLIKTEPDGSPKKKTTKGKGEETKQS